MAHQLPTPPHKNTPAAPPTQTHGASPAAFATVAEPSPTSTNPETFPTTSRTAPTRHTTRTETVGGLSNKTRIMFLTATTAMACGLVIAALNDTGVAEATPVPPPGQTVTHIAEPPAVKAPVDPVEFKNAAIAVSEKRQAEIDAEAKRQAEAAAEAKRQAEAAAEAKRQAEAAAEAKRQAEASAQSSTPSEKTTPRTTTSSSSNNASAGSNSTSTATQTPSNSDAGNYNTADSWASSSKAQSVIACESGGNYSINTGNGYYGAWQFDHQSWLANGGGQYAQYPHQATPSQQNQIAYNYYQKAGWRPWACA